MEGKHPMGVPRQTFALATALALCTLAQSPGPRSAFAVSNEPIGLSGSVSGRSIRASRVHISRELFDPAAARSHRNRRAPLSLAFPLLDGTSAIVNFDAVDARADFATWSGQVAGHPSGTATLAVVGSAVSGHLFLDNGRVFELATVAGGAVDWRELEPFPSNSVHDDQLFLPLARGASTRPATTEPAPTANPVVTDDGSRIDVLVVYTPAAKAAREGEDGIRALIHEGIAQTNQAYRNSGIQTQLRLAAAEEIAYEGDRTEPNSVHVEKLRLTNDGNMDEVHELRLKHKADLVSLWVDDPAWNNAGVCGNSYVVLAEVPEARIGGFGSVSVRCAVSNFSFAHELGHNLGAVHNRENTTTAGIRPFSYGHRNAAKEPYFGDIMSYPCPSVWCPRIPYFSNPDVSYQEIPTGVPQNQSGASDVAATFNLSRIWTAQYVDGPDEPAAVSLTPQESGILLETTQEFNFEFADPNGNETLSSIEILFQDAADSTKLTTACYLRVDSTGFATLSNDEGAFTGEPAFLGEAISPTLENSRCWLKSGTSGRYENGRVTLQVQFKWDWAEKEVKIYGRATDKDNLTSTWKHLGAVWLGPVPASE